jgi:hypothetical protein
MKDTAALDEGEALREAIRHLEHVLPAQAPIRDFVHHNTLHGFQHLPFREAIAAAAARTGARGFLPLAEFRAFYRGGRIGAADLESVLAEAIAPQPGVQIALAGSEPIAQTAIDRLRLLHPLDPVSVPRLHFEIEEAGALERFQADVDAAARARLLARAGTAAPAALADLWSACLELLDVGAARPHPEDPLAPDPLIDAPRWPELSLDFQEAHDAEDHAMLARLIGRVGEDWTLRDLMLALTGEDLLTHLRPMLIRQFAAHLDQGLAAWHHPGRGGGFWAAWRASVDDDPVWGLIDLPEWRQVIGRQPEDAHAALMQELRLLGLAPEKWARYLERLALELPGWAGMFLWREQHPGHAGLGAVPVALADLLAVRLVLERLFAHGLCRRRWRIEPALPLLRGWFRDHPAELTVRHALYNEHLPEHLLTQARGLTQQASFALDDASDAGWEQLAARIAAWHRHPGTGAQSERSAHGAAWPLFLLCQHLGLAGAALRTAGAQGAAALLDALRRIDEDEAAWLWLRAYERHYRDQILRALVANHGRAPWNARPQAGAATPSAQLVFCMDDREEGIRRHLEEIEPSVETFGAAGFFGVAMNWRGLDDEAVTPLCPIVVTPAHEAQECAEPEDGRLLTRHRDRRALRLHWKSLLNQGSRLGLLAPAAVTAVAAPFALAGLAGRLLLPGAIGRLARRLRERIDLQVPTRTAFQAPADSPPASPASPRFGFTDAEQADRVQGLLGTIGLTGGFAPLVAILGHGSHSVNNPHMSAYDCGACSGRHGGPNARVFAAMANRPEVRAQLAARGLVIPAQTHFVGAERDTCDESVEWYDADLLPEPHRGRLAQLDRQLAAAGRAHARERCRRFASAPPDPSPARAQRHVRARGHDPSQARPELGHVTNACALIGRRAMSRAAFFDRRAFLISYDPTQDAEGRVLEGILLAAGPVGAGISLEYYFSTVNNERWGCGTKVMHNVAGLLGIMDGAASDLRTGLPRQMIEIHEAMRLLVVAEQRSEVLSAICARQPLLAELIGNGWIQLAAKHPERAEIQIFEPDRGWMAWQAAGEAPPTVERSDDWIAGQTDALPPVLIRRAALSEAAE